MPSLEQVEYRPNFQFVVSPITQLISELQEVSPSSKLSGIINHIDYNWRDEGLTQDWYTLGNKIGFSMKKQMELLPNLENQSLILWTDRTEQDMAGFWLEYLTSDINIYPYRYIKEEKENYRIQLTNLRYQKDITEIASPEERGGSVVETLNDIKRFFTNPQTIDGSMAIMLSPLGPTGLKTDDEKPIDYPDSYVFLFEKKGDKVEGFTIQTDFTKQECREVIRRVTGVLLPENAREDEYIRTTSFLIPLFNQAKIQTNLDIVNLLQDVRRDFSWNSEYAYKNISWEKVKQDIIRADELYSLDIESDKVVLEWKSFMSEKHFIQESDDYSEQNMRLLIQKALAATILKLSKISLGRSFVQHRSQELQSIISLNKSEPVAVYSRSISLYDDFSFGDAQRYVESQPGCAGGGTSNNSPMELLTIESIVPRLGIVKGDFNNANDSCPSIKCKNCGWQASDSEAKAIQEKRRHTCPACGWKPT